MTPIRETIARAAMEARAHEDAPNVGDLLIGSEFIQSCFEDPDDPSDAPFFRSAYGLVIAKAVLRALDEAGCVVVRKEPMPEAVGAWWRVKNGHHFHDEPPPTDTSDYAAYRAMISASVVE